MLDSEKPHQAQEPVKKAIAPAKASGATSGAPLAEEPTNDTASSSSDEDVEDKAAAPLATTTADGDVDHTSTTTVDDDGNSTPTSPTDDNAVVGVAASKELSRHRPPPRGISSALLKQQERLNQETDTELKAKPDYDAWNAPTKEFFRDLILERNTLRAGGCEVATPNSARASGEGNPEGAKLSGDGGSAASRKRKSDTTKAKPTATGQQRVSLVVSAPSAGKKAARKTAAVEEEEEDFAQPQRKRKRDDENDILNK